MIFEPRWYQREAIDAGVEFFLNGLVKYHSLLLLPTGSGKSLVIAEIAKALKGGVLILQPSKEILLQNYAKFVGYGYRAGIYSASAGSKLVDDVTFATVKSIADKPHLFKKFKYIIIDECHLVNAEEGQYQELIYRLSHCKVLGLTATPYRLTSDFEGGMLRFLNQTTPKIFSKILYYVQNDVLFNEGFLAPLNYYDFNSVDRGELVMNKKGTDFTEQSVRAYYRKIDMPKKIIEVANKVLKRRKNILIFCSLISEAITVAKGIPGAAVLTDETTPEQRTKIEYAFKCGRIRCVVNVRCWDTGFDFPGLEAVLIGKSTMSLGLWYQMVGRVIRKFIYPDGTVKTGWVIDMGGNLRLFGKVEDLKIKVDRHGEYSIWNGFRQLTDVTFSKN
jgi:DNA repair protein RadD